MTYGESYIDVRTVREGCLKRTHSSRNLKCKKKPDLLQEVGCVSV